MSWVRLFPCCERILTPEAVCVPKATVRVSGASARSMADTFFPGYGWRPVECPICGAHLGWHFDRGTNCRPEDEPPAHENAAVAMRKIGRYCLSKSLGYWVVEWCNRDKVVQYHVEHNMRKPEYSLGTFVEAIAAVDGDLEDFAKLPGVPGRRLHHLQRFDGGQRCDETNGPRSTRVIAVCCRDSASAVGDFSIADFRETSVCQYSLTICVPDLCRVKGFSPVLANQEECRAVPPGSVDAFVALDVESTVADPSTEMKWAEGIKPVVGVIPT